MNKKLRGSIGLAVVVIASFFTACDDDHDYYHNPFSCREFSATNVEPNLGYWLINWPGNLYDCPTIDFSVVDVGGVKMIDLLCDNDIEDGQYGHYPTYGDVIIHNGAFQWQWGDYYGTHCPTDGFCFSGHFLSATTGEGTMNLMRMCDITQSFDWTAEYVPAE